MHRDADSSCPKESNYVQITLKSAKKAFQWLIRSEGCLANCWWSLLLVQLDPVSQHNSGGCLPEASARYLRIAALSSDHWEPLFDGQFAEASFAIGPWMEFFVFAKAKQYPPKTNGLEVRHCLGRIKARTGGNSELPASVLSQHLHEVHGHKAWHTKLHSSVKRHCSVKLRHQVQSNLERLSTHFWAKTSLKKVSTNVGGLAPLIYKSLKRHDTLSKSQQGLTWSTLQTNKYCWKAGTNMVTRGKQIVEEGSSRCPWYSEPIQWPLLTKMPKLQSLEMSHVHHPLQRLGWIGQTLVVLNYS